MNLLLYFKYRILGIILKKNVVLIDEEWLYAAIQDEEHPAMALSVLCGEWLWHERWDMC